MRYVLALLFLLLAPAAYAQETRFARPLPPSADYTVHKNVAYTRTDTSVVSMDVYTPARGSSADRHPVVLFLSTRFDRPQREHPIYVGWAAAATSFGMVAINPAAAPDFDAGFDALLRYLREHAAELRIDPERVSIYAASGNVVNAFPAVQNPARSAVRAAVFYYGFSDSIAFRPDLPVLFVRAGLDRPGLNEKLDAMVAAGLAANAPVHAWNHASGRHGFETLDHTDATRAVIEGTLRFLISALDPSYQKSLRDGVPLAEAAGAMTRGDFATAVSRYAPLVESNPTDVRLRLAYGEALLGAARYKEARAQFEGLRNAGLGYRDLGIPAARAALADGDPDAAVGWLKTIPKRFFPVELLEDPDFAVLRTRQDFQELFR